MSFNDHYEGRRVLVTGHTGFKGGWLSLWLKQLGAELCGISLPPETTPNLYDVAEVGAGMETHFLDLAEAERLKDIVRAFAPEIVFHLAAQPFVRRSYQQPVATFAANVMGTIHVLEAVRAAPSIRTVIVITSDKVYENRNTGKAFQVGDRLGGSDPYSASKSCAEGVVQCWRQSFFDPDGQVKIVSARAGNVFGGGDWGEDRLVPDIARAIAADAEIVLRNPGSVRPWQHVLDVSAGYLALGAALEDSKPGFPTAWNFGPVAEESMTVATFARRMVEAWQTGRVVERPDPKAPRESILLNLDSSQSVDLLGWHPRLTLPEAIAWTVSWYRTARQDPSAAAEASIRQLRDYGVRLSNSGAGP